MSSARLVAGQYRLIRPIGQGASATVFVAQDGAGRSLALKVLPARPGLRPDEADRFRTEAPRLGQVEHPGVVPYLDAGVDPEGPSLYLTMELLHGETLRDRLALGGDPDAALDLLEGALVPLSHLHGRGQVHGDLTPSNVFWLRPREGHGVVRLLDTGLAPFLTQHRLVGPMATLGSPSFMAPEQLEPRASISPAADVWSFGVALYEALTGERPFDRASREATAEAALREPHRPVLDVAPHADEGMAQLVELCLHKEPVRRPPDGRSLLRLFKTIRSGIASQPRGAPGSPIDTVLDRSGAAPPPPPEDLDRALRRTPRDPDVHRALLGHYESVRSRDGVWLAACALAFLRAATKDELRLTHHYRGERGPTPDQGLSAASWAALLHPDQDPRVDGVWSVLHDALARVHRRAQDEEELTQTERVDFAKPTSDLARAFNAAVGTIRPNELPRLHRGRAGVPPRHLATLTPTSVFPKGFEEPLPQGSLPFAVGRHVAYYRPAHRVCTLIQEPEALEATFSAAVDLGRGKPPEDPAKTELMRALVTHLPPPRQGALRTATARLGTSADRVDLGTWRRAVELSCMRAGLVLGSDLEGAAWALRWSRERRRIPLEDAVDDLLRFWSSGDHVRVRHMLGHAIEG